MAKKNTNSKPKTEKAVSKPKTEKAVSKPKTEKAVSKQEKPHVDDSTNAGGHHGMG